MRRLAAVLCLLCADPVWAEDSTPPPAPVPLAVQDVDRFAYDRYLLMERVARLSLENEALKAQAALEREKKDLNARFLNRYNLHVDQVDKRGDQFYPKEVK